MGFVSGGVYAMGVIGELRHDFSGLTHRIPWPIQILVLIVLIIAVSGILSKFRAAIKGKASAMDYLGMLIVLFLLVLVVLIVGSGLIRSLGTF